MTESSRAQGARPTTLDEYQAWLLREHEVELGEPEKEYHELVALRIRSTFESSAFWTALAERLRVADAEYRLRARVPLFVGDPGTPTLEVKSFKSLVLNTIRKNPLD